MRLKNPFRKGREFERQLVNQAKEEGYIALRSAGSKSLIDVVIIEKENKIIQLIQCKNTKTSIANLQKGFDLSESGYKVIWKAMQPEK